MDPFGVPTVMDFVEISGNFKIMFSMPENVLEIYSKYLMTFTTKYIINETSLLCRVNMP